MPPKKQKVLQQDDEPKVKKEPGVEEEEEQQQQPRREGEGVGGGDVSEALVMSNSRLCAQVVACVARRGRSRSLSVRELQKWRCSN